MALPVLCDSVQFSADVAMRKIILILTDNKRLFLSCKIEKKLPLSPLYQPTILLSNVVPFYKK